MVRLGVGWNSSYLEPRISVQLSLFVQNGICPGFHFLRSVVLKPEIFLACLGVR
jgi:hypothetical protein